MAKTPNERPTEPDPDAPRSSIEDQILGEIAKAREKWGETIELKMLLGNWGDTFDDDRMLEGDPQPLADRLGERRTHNRPPF